MQRLSQAHLAKLPAAVQRPRYDRSRLEIGLGHIGVGAFHRCHQAEFTEDMLESTFGRWGLVGINLKPPILSESLGAQDGLYSRTLRHGDKAETRVIGAIRRVIDAGTKAGMEAAISALAAPSLHTVSMTITEKGYCHTPASGALDWTNADLRRDRDNLGQPGTVLGFLAKVLERRMAMNAPGMTLISCDNLPANGALLERVLTGFLETRPKALAQWVERHVCFPSTMVDRIVPATTQVDIDNAAQVLGLEDRAAVTGEPFRQWVIEDRFSGVRPPWDLAGAQFVSDVTPYELIKMRVLNAAQSTLSHLGAIVGHTYSFEAAADPVLSSLVKRMLEHETISTLPVLADMPAQTYIDTSLSRIRNAAIKHRCHQIGTDGSQKIVQRLVNPLRERLRQGREPGLLALAVASWMAYVLCGAVRFGARWTPDDPWADRVIAIGEEGGGDFRALAQACLAISEIFGTDLASSPAASAIGRHLEGLLSADAKGYLQGLMTS